MDLLRSEWIKFHTVRVTYVLSIIAGAFPLVFVVLVTALRPRPGVGEDFDLVGMVTGTMVLTALLMGVVSALSLTNEYSHGTIRSTFAAVPKRRNVLIAKAFVALVVTMVYATIVMIVSLVVGQLISRSRGAHISLSGDDRAAMFGLIALCGLVSLLGYALALIIRNSAATVTLLVLWPLLLENLVRLVLTATNIENPTRFLPYQSAIVMTVPRIDPTDPSRIQGGLYLGAVVFALIVIGIVINERRDA